METLKFMCDCTNEAGAGVSGTLTIYDDKIVFRPAKLMRIMTFWNKWKDLSISLKDIKGCEKRMLGYFAVLLNDGSSIQLNSFKKGKIIDAIKTRREELYRLEGKVAPTFILLG